jgi:hypothetical protein
VRSKRRGRKERPITDVTSATLEKERRYACTLFRANSLKEGAMWRIDHLLGNDSETKETTAVVRQRLSRQRSGLESGVFYGVRADGCACNNGYKNQRIFYAVRADGL